MTDKAVPLADSEAAALAGTGHELLVKGCVVQIIKTTDRAVRVHPLRCPEDPNQLPLAKWVDSTTEGWVAKSALDLTR